MAIGNAPTALLALCEQIAAGFRPALIVAVPVGFVNVVESKERILRLCREQKIPCIAALGRKGGSSVAAAVCNALLYQAAGALDPMGRAAALEEKRDNCTITEIEEKELTYLIWKYTNLGLPDWRNDGKKE